jgi:O-succinylbenzoate synthase
MDAGVVLRERRLKTRDGLFIHLQGEREGWGKFLPAGIQWRRWKRRKALLAWAQAWRDGAEPPLPTLPSVAFGISCAQAELAANCRRPRIIARRRSAPAIRMSCSPDWRRCPARKSLR